MIEAMIAKRYARALLELALEGGTKTVDAYANQLKKFQDVCEFHREFLPTLANHHFDLFARERIVNQIAKQLDFDEQVTNFLKLLIHKGRIGLFAFVLSAYNKFTNEVTQRSILKVVSATELSAQNYQSLVEHFHRETGREIILVKDTDPTLLGGIRVHLGDQVYDYTIKGQLERLRQRLAA